MELFRAAGIRGRRKSSVKAFALQQGRPLYHPPTYLESYCQMITADKFTKHNYA